MDIEQNTVTACSHNINYTKRASHYKFKSSAVVKTSKKHCGFENHIRAARCCATPPLFSDVPAKHVCTCSQYRMLIHESNCWGYRSHYTVRLCTKHLQTQALHRIVFNGERRRCNLAWIDFLALTGSCISTLCRLRDEQIIVEPLHYRWNISWQKLLVVRNKPVGPHVLSPNLMSPIMGTSHTIEQYSCTGGV